MSTYTPEQRRIQQLALSLSRGRRPKLRRSLLEALAVEANFTDPPGGDSTSEGGLQQRPDQGWGPASETLATDIQQYIERASALLAQGFRGTAGELAQAVQRSAYPGRYDQHRAEANAILAGALGSGGATAAAASPGAIADAMPGRAELVQQLVGAVKRKNVQGQLDALAALKGNTTGAVRTPSAPRAGRAGQKAGGGRVTELIYDPEGSIFDGVRSTDPYGGHDDHVHAASGNPHVMLAIIHKAQQLGLAITENPYTTGQLVRSGHAKDSWHKREFPGRYDGRVLGMGADISGDPRRMSLLYRWAARKFG